MQPTRLWRLACLLVLGSAALASCGEDEASKPSTTPQGGVGASAGTKATPTGGNDSVPVGGNAGTAGSSTAGSAMGGSSSNVGGDATAGAGAEPPTGVGGDAGAGGALGGGGNGPLPTGEQLVLCTRITGKIGHVDDQSRAFAKALFADCHIKWVVPLGSGLDDYRQQLVDWSYDFWGCEVGSPVADFGLVYGTPALSVGDANLIIEHYLTTVDAEVQLSTDERLEMKAALDRLAKQLISSPAEEPSQSSCVANTGGAAGAGGAP